NLGAPGSQESLRAQAALKLAETSIQCTPNATRYPSLRKQTRERARRSPASRRAQGRCASPLQVGQGFAGGGRAPRGIRAQLPSGAAHCALLSLAAPIPQRVP